jgi:hypothetical protein
MRLVSGYQMRPSCRGGTVWGNIPDLGWLSRVNELAPPSTIETRKVRAKGLQLHAAKSIVRKSPAWRLRRRRWQRV